MRKRATAVTASDRRLEKQRFLHNLVLLIVFAVAVILLSSCIKGPDSDAVDFGPEESAADVSKALSDPTKDMSATDIRINEFFAVEDTQELAGGAAFSHLSDSAATITSKTETPQSIVFGGVMHEATYESDGSVSKVSREGNLLCVAKVTGGCGEAESAATKTTKASMLSYASPETLLAKAVTGTGVRETYHRLTKSTLNVSPPARVRNQPNCLGIPNCTIKIHKIGFDQVIWEDDKPTRVHIDAILSNEVPYLSRNLSTCYTLVAGIASSSSTVLVKNCSNVYDFRFGDQP